MENQAQGNPTPAQPNPNQDTTTAPMAQQPAANTTVTPVQPAPAPVAQPAAPAPAAQPQAATPAPAVTQAAPAVPADKPQDGPVKILVVEDEVDARTMFVDLLSSETYEVSSAVDGVDALAKAAADKYQLILLDIVMPNKDGIEVLQEIKANPDKYGTPVVVMLTNISGDAAIEKAMEIGAAGFRLKVDTEPTQLLQDVQDFLAGKVQNIEDEPVSKPIA